MAQKLFLIVTPPYEENNGGAIALHKLCQHLNELGREAYLFPYLPTARYDTEDPVAFQHCIAETQRLMSTFVVNPAITSAVAGVENLDRIKGRDDIVVVYPEIIAGNPLQAKNVARWLMHDAGFFTRKVYFCPGEIYFLYGVDTKPVHIPGSRMSSNLLATIHIPFELYNLNGATPHAERTQTAFCVRKGRGKPLQHDLTNSTMIDGLPHARVAEIFKRSRQFISYDSRTFYSRLAVLCGCESIVIPDPGVSEEEWMPDPEGRYGVAYGFENLEKARQTASRTIEFLHKMEANSVSTTQQFIAEVEAYFDGSARG